MERKGNKMPELFGLDRTKVLVKFYQSFLFVGKCLIRPDEKNHTSL